jgi:SPP1 gp7 family putative phage head morphogenesis protein
MTKETNFEVAKFFRTGMSKEYFDATDEKYYQAMDDSVGSQARMLSNYLLSKWQTIFSKKSSLYANDMYDELNKYSQKSVENSLKVLTGGLTIKSNFESAGLKEISKTIIAENISLIKSIPADYMKSINGKMMRSISTNNLQDLNDALNSYAEITEKTERKVELIANDQVRKSNNAIAASRLKTHGVKKFEWIHSGGGQKPRQLHIDMDGEIYSFDDLPVIDERTGETGLPGQAINCGCTMNPVIELDDEDCDDTKGDDDDE